MSVFEKISDYMFIKDIGEGNFGKVKLAIKKETGEQFAIKIMNKEKIRNQMGRLLIPEIEISKKFNHKNVIRVYSIIEDDINYYIVMEYCSKGELFDYIVSKKKLSKDEASIFFYQLINGIEHIHSMGFAHRDLKPENLLITKNNILKIIDFGLTHKYDENMLLKTKCGSPSYAAPEILKGKKYDGFKSDIWCCGIILHAMLCGFLPFQGENNKILFKNIIKCDLKLNQFDDEIIKKLIKSILNPNPLLRISLSEIKQNEFYLKGEALFHKNENISKYKKIKSTDKKYFKIDRNNIIDEDHISKRQNKINVYKLFDKLSTDRINKINFNLLSHTNNNSTNKDSKKYKSDKKSLDLRFLQMAKNDEKILFRHSNKNKKLKIKGDIKLIQKSDKIKYNYLLKFNLNEKIKKILKKNNSEEGRDEKDINIKNKILSNCKKESNIYTKTNVCESERNKQNKIIELNNSKKEYKDSISAKSKIEEINGRSKSLKNKKIINTCKYNFYNKLTLDEPLIFKNKEKNYKINDDKKSYNLYRIVVNNDKLQKTFGMKIKKYLLTENSKLNAKRVLNLRNKEIFDEFLPILKNHN